MDPIRSIAYTSSTTGTLPDDALARLLVDARSFNESVGVTGVLLYNGASFFQYLEGSAVACERVYQRIAGSSRHHSVHTLADQFSEARYFSNWTMGFSMAPGSALVTLGQAEWRASPAVDGARSNAASNGVAMLMAFWHASFGAS